MHHHGLIRGIGGSVVELTLVILLSLLSLLAAAMWSCARSYFDRGRRRGLADAAREIIHGAQAQLGSRQGAVPGTVLKTTAKLTRTIANPNLPCEPALWEFGHALADACWQNGYGEGVHVGAIPDDKIRIEVSLQELLQMSWLAHLGFQHMMPNYRGFELHRFNGADDALEGARSVAILECALPRSERPFEDIHGQIANREQLISDWWTRVREHAPA
jgi:type II secretory pathway pseudopilin PulG